MSARVSPSKNRMSTTSFNHLPQETAAEILVRLPVKDLIRSTSVHKTWYSLINNPSFISLQIRRCISHCDENVVLIIPPITSHQNYCSLISADTSSLIQKFDIPFETKSHSLRLVAQIHGLLLLTDLHVKHAFRDLYLWNPYVKRHMVFVSSCFKKVLDDSNKSYCVAGMGYVKSTDDYKVVRIVYFIREVAPKAEVYSFRKHTWRKLKNPRVYRLVHGYGIYVDGCYYWLEYKQPGTNPASIDKEFRVMSFDFETELFREFKVPDDVPHSLGENSPFKLLKFENSLALCYKGSPLSDNGVASYPYYVMSMKQEKGVVAWTLSFTFVLEKFGYPLDITEDGTLIIESVHSESDNVTSIISYNLKTMIRKDHGFGKHGDPELSRYVRTPSTVDTSFPQSLIMYEGGNHC